MMKSTLIALAIAGAASTSALADSSTQINVKFDRADLMDAERLAQLQQQLNNAIREVCAIDGRVSAHTAMRSFRCRAEARANINRQLNVQTAHLTADGVLTAQAR